MTKTVLEFNGRNVGMLHTATFPTLHSLVITFQASLSGHFLQWVRQSLRGGSLGDGAIVVVNYAGDVVDWYDWRGARVTKIELPSVDAANTHAVDDLSITLQISSVFKRT
ncbi:MAG: hypothetical protein ABI625_00005, partial [bacterium]